MPDPSALSPTVRLRVWGERACFTRPEMKVERVSYEVMTPSAARGILEAVLWRPEMRWRVERIDVLAPIRWGSVRRNEVERKLSPRNVAAAMQGAMIDLGIDAPSVRQQRATLFLRDVDYVIHARPVLTPRAGPTDNLAKYVAMFERRAAAGQCFHRPYLGTREFAADFSLVGPDVPAPIAESRDLGWMLLDIDYGGPKPTPLFFPARLETGSLCVPSSDAEEVRR